MVYYPLLDTRQSFSIPHPPELGSKNPLFLYEESRAPEILAGNACLQLVGTLFFIARVYSRIGLTKSWKWEDTFLAVAWLMATAYTICQYGQVAHGAGHHLRDVIQNNPHDPIDSQKWAYAGNIILLPALTFPKLSICMAYSRIFAEGLLDQRIIQSLIVLIAIPNIPFFFLNVFQCKPIHVYWTEGRPIEKCRSSHFSTFYIHGGINVFVDIALMIIVLPRILDLHVSPRQRRALITIVGLGSLAAIAGIVRMARVTVTLANPNFDPSWDAYDISIWNSTEVYVSLICAAAPGIKPVVSLLLPKILGTSLNGQTLIATEEGPNAGIELHSKRRATIGSARTRLKTHDTILDEGDGPYAEVGRGVDRDEVELRDVDVERGRKPSVFTSWYDHR